MPNQITPVVRALLIANIAVFALQAFSSELPFLPFMLWPLGQHVVGIAGGLPLMQGFEPWQLVSYGFLQGNLTHLFFNMFALWMFGPALEMALRPRRFAFYYFTCVIGAGLVQLAVVTAALKQGEPPFPTVGASGGVFGILLGYGLLFPRNRMMLIFPPVEMSARTFVILYGAAELAMGVFNTRSGVAHFAHLGGMAFGFFLLQYWRGRWPFRRRRSM